MMMSKKKNNKKNMCILSAHHELCQCENLHLATAGPLGESLAEVVEENQTAEFGSDALLLILQQGSGLLFMVAHHQGDLR